MVKKQLFPTSKSSNTDVKTFLDLTKNLPSKANSNRTGRLLFTLDATASRQSTWDTACQIQGDIFLAANKAGELNLQLAYYRGYQEFKRSHWHNHALPLVQAMTQVECLGGHTQIHRVLKYAIEETRRSKINAVVFIGDAIEESIDHLCELAGQLGVLKTPLFIFQEGNNPSTAQGFKQMAKLSGGAYEHFNEMSAEKLKTLLKAVAVFASGGKSALSNYQLEHLDAQALLVQLK